MARVRAITTFTINNAGVERMGKGPEARVIVRTVAELMKTYAESIAPKESGDYARSFGVKMHIRHDWPSPPGRPNPRVCADVVNSDPGAIAIEKGSTRKATGGGIATTPAHWVLRRTLEHFAAISGRPQRRRRPRRKR